MTTWLHTHTKLSPSSIFSNMLYTCTCTSTCTTDDQRWSTGHPCHGTGGHSEHTRRQLVFYLTGYLLTTAQSTTQLALFVYVKVPAFHSFLRLLLSVNLEQTKRFAPLTSIRMQLYSILKSDWSGAWLLFPIVTRTVNSIVSAGYSCKVVIMRIK